MRALALASVLALLASASSCDEDQGTSTRNESATGFEEAKFPHLSEGEECPQAGAISLRGISGQGALGPFDPGDPSASKLKRGPIYAMLSGAPRFINLSFPDDSPPRRSSSALVQFISKSSYDGPVVVDGQRLDGPGHITFGGEEAVRRLKLPAGSWVDARGVERGREDSGRRVSQVMTDFPAEGCYGLRVTGDDFAYVLPVVVFGN